MISLLYGGITHHYVGSNLPYCNKINNYGSIRNEYLIVMAGTNKFKAGLLNGKDSACGNILGPITSFKLKDNLEFIAGYYNTNFDKFRKINIEPPSYKGITPVVGLDFRIPIYKNNKSTISIDNLISIGVVTHSLRVDF